MPHKTTYQRDDRVRTKGRIRDVDDRLDRVITVAIEGDLGTVVHVDPERPLLHVWFDGREKPVGVHPKTLEKA